MKTKVCRICKKDKTIDEFAWENKAKGKKQTHCKECQRERSKQHYIDNKSGYKEKARKRRKRYRKEYQDLKSTLSCSRCPENHPACLDFHHKDGEEKEHNISRMVGLFCMDRIKDEIDKCEVLCKNCHAKLHWG